MVRWQAEVDKSVLLILAVACLVQLGYLADSRDDPTFEVPIVDASVYHNAAVGFASGEPLAEGAFWQPPLFPAFLGVFYALTGPSVVAARLMLAALAVTSCLLMYQLGCRLFGRPVGMVAALALAVYGPFVFFATRLLATGLGIFLGLLSLLLLLRALDRPLRRWRWVIAGACSGLAIINIPNAVVILAVALITMVREARRRGVIRGYAVGGSLLLGGALVIIAPVTIRNYLVSGEFVVLSTNGGINFYVGNNPDTDTTVAIRPGEYWRRLTRMGTNETPRTRAQQSAFFYRQALTFARNQPGSFITGLGRKALCALNAREIPRNVDIYVHDRFSNLLSVLCWRWGSFGFPFGLVAPLAVVGMVVAPKLGSPSARIRLRRALPMWFALLYGASVVLFFVTARYRLPAVCVAVLFAAVAIVWFWQQWTSKKETSSRRVRIAAGLAFVVSALVVNLPIRTPTDDVDFEAELYLSVGAEELKLGMLRDAREHLSKALELDPDHAVTYVHLGDLSGRLGHQEEAELHYRRTALLNPDSANARTNMGALLSQQQRYTEAVEWFLEALKRDPTSPGARAGLMGDFIVGKDAKDRGSALARFADALIIHERYKEAIECYRKAHSLTDLAPASLERLARLLATCPRKELRDCAIAMEAAEHLCRITEYQDARALSTLALVYDACNRSGKAVEAQQRAVEIAERAGAEDVEGLRKKLADYRARLSEQSGSSTETSAADERPD
jgi:tetratricopeptide (TPR) repeat protein/4-amino-4-deoxy-L-arabinose transferase-like glycosyltransferase